MAFDECIGDLAQRQMHLPAQEDLHGLIEAGRIGFHSFHHGLATMLRQNGVDIKTDQELLRHANSRITLEIYKQAVSAEKRVAQNTAFKGLLRRGLDSAPSEMARKNQSLP
jgi:integrase